MASFFHTVLYVPIYNLLIFLVDIVPGGDVGLAVVFVTIIIKVILMPLSLRAAHTQRRMKHIEPQLKKLREKHKDDKEEQAKQMMALYKEHDIRPFASMFGVLIQIPIVISLYLVFRREALFTVDLPLLYSFTTVPHVISPIFLGIFTVSGGSIVLSLLAAVAQFFQARLSIPVPNTSTESRSASEDFGRAMAVQARYVLPIIIGLVSYFTSGAIALYFITSNLIGILQEFIVRRMKHPTPSAVVPAN